MDRRRLLALLGCALAMVLAAPAQAAVVDDDPAIAAQGAGDIRLFVRGTDGALWTRSWNGSNWSSWSSLGGVLTSGPSAMVRPGGVYDVFVRGPNNGYYQKSFSPSTGWSDWIPMSTGVFTSAPSASYRKVTGEVDLVGIGLNNELYHSFWTPSQGWSSFGSLGGDIRGRPSMISPAEGIIDIYVRGGNNALYQKSWISSSGWTDFAFLGGSLTSGIAATSWDGNRRDIFARGGNNSIYIKSFQAPAGWNDWASIGSRATSAPAATSSGPGRLEIATRSGQGINLKTYATTWSAWNSLGRAPLYRAPTPSNPNPPPANPGGELRLRAGFGCIPVGGRVPVRVRVYQRNGRLKPRVIKVVFFIDGGKRRRVDRHKPYKTRMRVTFKRGSKHRVHARIFFRRKGSKRVHRKTVSKRFTMCAGR